MEPKAGDWVVITISDRDWNSKMNQFDGTVLKFKGSVENSSSDRLFENPTTGMYSWNWHYKKGHYRLALPEEIPGYVKTDEYPIF